jgi:hypothetical protein
MYMVEKVISYFMGSFINLGKSKRLMVTMKGELVLVSILREEIVLLIDDIHGWLSKNAKITYRII